MKSSLFLAASSAILALGAAVDKRAMETQWDVKWVTVTVTAGQAPAPLQTDVQEKHFQEDRKGGNAGRPGPVFSTIKPDVEEKPTVTVVTKTRETPKADPSPEPQPEPEPEPQPEPQPEPEEEAEPEEETQSEEESTDDGYPEDPQALPSTMKGAALHAHNIHRANHSVSALTWSQDHSDFALQTAKTCVFEHDLTPGGGGYGQNLAMWGATDGDGLGEAKAIGQATTNMWYNGELGLYNFFGQEPDMSNFLGWGHFSQMVWADTEQVGCAVHFCPKGTMNADMGVWYSVCNYFPAGNVGGGYTDNVLPPGKASTVSF